MLEGLGVKISYLSFYLVSLVSLLSWMLIFWVENLGDGVKKVPFSSLVLDTGLNFGAYFLGGII